MKKRNIFPLLCVFLLYVGSFLIETKIPINLMEKNQAPSFRHLFGTDWLGRDMLLRTVKGLQFSITIGILTAFFSTIVATIGSMLSMTHQYADRVISWLIDLFLSLPHLVTLIIISFVLGGGLQGVMVGLTVTHWPTLARVLRAELMQLREQPYYQLSGKLGKNIWWRARHHFLPHLLPQIIIGFMLIFPHAILHEATITFLGFGLSAEQPAIGIILAESMQYLSNGRWWLAFFPGLLLLIIMLSFHHMANDLKRFTERDRSYESFIKN